MSLKIENICLDNFRGYSHLFLDGLKDLTIVVGPNAVGKTNIIEAIQLLTAASSFRKSSWPEIISWGQQAARASILMKDEKRIVEHVINIKDNERSYEVNGKKKGVASIRGTLPCVLFTPDDLQLVKASSSKRRENIDNLASQLSKNYQSLKSNYQQVLKQRNLLIREEVHSGALFESWNESLAVHGSRLCVNRWRLLDRLSKHMKEIYSQIVDRERLDVVYIPSWKRFDEKCRQIGDFARYEDIEDKGNCSLEEVERILDEYSKRLADAEVRRGTTLIGPHKDEIAFYINGKNARMFASQGQQRTIVLVLKLACVEVVNEIGGVEPILLLDDVMSELDSRHREALASFILKNTQSIVTTTNIDYFSRNMLEQAEVIEVPIEGTRYLYE